MRNINIVLVFLATLVIGSQAKATERIFPSAGLTDGRSTNTDNQEITIVRGYSPRSDGISHQYQYMGTPLRGNFILSDIMLPADRWHKWDGTPANRFDLSQQTPENYHESHNHYQSFLSEVVNATAGSNGIPVWGDSAAVVDGANAWGGFFSARSACDTRDLIDKYLPKSINRGCGPDFDAQLTGLEVDVLNSGKPGVFGNKAKHGVQIVGFGNPNGQAVSVISENFDREEKFRRGQFESILYAQNSIHPEYGRFIVMDFDKASIGLDMRKPLFRNGAIDFHTEGVGTGIQVNSGRSGEIYGGLRWPNFEDKQEWLTARLGTGGFKLASNDNMREFMAVDNNGGIYLYGDVFINDKNISKATSVMVGPTQKSTIILMFVFLLLSVAINIMVTRYMLKGNKV